MDNNPKTSLHLELLQVEIRSNYLTALHWATEREETGSAQSFPNFSTSVYDAGLESGYILTIPLPLQSKMIAVYGSFLPEINYFVKQQVMIVDEYAKDWQRCVFEEVVNSNDPAQSCATKKQIQDLANQTAVSELRKYVATSVEEELQELADQFNPTQERLKSPLLLFLMGKEALGIQK